MTSPTSMPLHLVALEKAAAPADAGQGGDARLRSAIVNVAGYYLRLAQSRTPAQMEALIWGKDSLDGADHGPSCAAFASLTLELAAQAVGQQSWVTGGTTYPWPLHEWADVRVDPNPDSLGITSIVQDAQAHGRWHPLGDGYVPQPGDWVLFEGHVEVVTSYAGGVLDTIGADSLPNLTVNAHSFPDPLAERGVQGFVDNGHLGGGEQAPAVQPEPAGAGAAAAGAGQPAAAAGAGQPAARGGAGQPPGGTREAGGTGSAGPAEAAAIPGVVTPATGIGMTPDASSGAAPQAPDAPAAGPVTAPAAGARPSVPSGPAQTPRAPYRKYTAPGAPGTKAPP